MMMIKNTTKTRPIYIGGQDLDEKDKQKLSAETLYFLVRLGLRSKSAEKRWPFYHFNQGWTLRVILRGRKRGCSRVDTSWIYF